MLLAEREGFEPSVPFDTPVFKTGALNHYATSPIGLKSISTSALYHFPKNNKNGHISRIRPFFVLFRVFQCCCHSETFGYYGVLCQMFQSDGLLGLLWNKGTSYSVIGLQGLFFDRRSIGRS
jgi:hypothetical protein